MGEVDRGRSIETWVTERGGKEAPRSLAIWPESFLIELRTRDRVWGICVRQGFRLRVWSERCVVMARSRDDIMPFVNTLCRLLKSEMIIIMNIFKNLNKK